jgi:tRNA-specific 2-thiouridylase
MKAKKPKIIVAMSGGVDSSVAAALLKKQGFDVIGVMMRFWSERGGNRCCSIESENLARLVAKKIGIPFYVINVEREFKKKIVDYFLREYKAGNTPNPCVVCNKEIKFGLLLEKALKLGADFVATGHYARISFGSNSPLAFARQRGLTQASAFSRFAGPCKMPAGYASNLLPHLFVGKDKQKDQSYFLWQLSQKQLARIIFPVGNLAKPEVRKLAKKFKLPTAQTPESQEVCFVSGDTNDFLGKYLKYKPGLIVDTKNNILGKHNGLWFYTIGQRKGIGFSGGPWYVVGKDLKKNTLIISKNQKDLFKKEFKVKNISWINPVKLPIEADVKTRYKSPSAKAKILKNNKIIFKNPQRAITPGQSAVFYSGRQLLGGGIIV